jgi:uncharacterized repeat protein (TIGR01451 family)
MVIASNLVYNGDSLDFMIVAHSPSSDYSFTGDDGLEYGGDIGEFWGGTVVPFAYGDVYQQDNSYISLVISQTTEMIVRKTLESGTLAPGEYIQYRIFYSNAGPNPAIDVEISDFIPNGTIYSQGSLFKTGTGSLTDGVAGTNLVYDSSLSDWVDVLAGDDEGYYDAGEVIFTPDGGFAPTKGDTLTGSDGIVVPGASGSFLFSVMINTNNPPLFITNTVSLQGANFSNAVTNLILAVTLSSQSNTTLYISKSISNIMLAGPSKPIPGASILYKISYSNTGSVAATDGIIVDELPTRVRYWTNAGGTATGWTMQYSTLASPDQSYGSIAYTNVPVPVAQRLSVKWIRWKKPSIGASETGTFLYKMIIK